MGFEVCVDWCSDRPSTTPKHARPAYQIVTQFTSTLGSILHAVLPMEVSQDAQETDGRGHPVKWVIVFAAVNVVVFLLYMPPFIHLLTGGGLGDLAPYIINLLNDGGYPEWALYHPQDPDMVQLVSHQFAHAGLAHLWANLVALLYCGKFAEPKYGGYVAAVYLLGGAAGALAHGFWDVHPLLGSSGAVSAVLGSCMFLNIRWQKKARVIGVWLVIYNVIPLFFAFDNISYAAHIGGFAAGIILGAAYATLNRGRGKKQSSTA